MVERSELAVKPQDAVYESLQVFSTGLEEFLSSLGLPTDRVLVSVGERKKVIFNLPSVIEAIEASKRGKSLYISKFIAACGVGLFDAALNFIWDETVLNLRDRVAKFDLQYFFSGAITDENRRKNFKSEDDLRKVEDWELIRGSHQIGLLSDVGFKHLDYIRDMRNWASAAHPNQVQLSGLQLVSWLETCINEVIAKEPQASVIEVKRLLVNIRQNTLQASDIPSIHSNIIALPSEVAASLFRTCFGMFCDPDISSNTKNNIKLISKSLWDSASEETRGDAGIRFSIYAANADLTKKALAKEFLEFVGGLSYLPPNELSREVDEKLGFLFQTHLGLNNFYNEPPHARNLCLYVPDSGRIPRELKLRFVKVVTMCRIGNGYGTSWEAVPYYDTLIGKFGEEEIFLFGLLPIDQDVSSRLQFSSCVLNYRNIAKFLFDRASNQFCKSHLKILIDASPDVFPVMKSLSEMKNFLDYYKKQYR